MIEAITTQFLFKFFLVFARFAALIVFLPGLGDERVLLRFKLLFSVFTSLVIIQMVEASLPSFTASSSTLLFYLASESLVGVMIGLCVRIYYTSFLILGNLISMESGLSAASMFDPGQKEQIMIFSSFLMLLSLITIFSTDTHHIFISGFIESYSKFKPGFMLDLGDLANRMSGVASDSFLLAFKISSPFLIVGVAILVGSGVLSRLMPTLQVLFVITPVQILVMFAVLFIVVGNIIELVIQNMVGVF